MMYDSVNQLGEGRGFAVESRALSIEENEDFYFTADSQIEGFETSCIARNRMKSSSSRNLTYGRKFLDISGEQMLRSKSTDYLPIQLISSLGLSTIKEQHEQTFQSARSSLIFYEFIEGAMEKPMTNSSLSSLQSSPVISSSRSTQDSPHNSIIFRINKSIKPICLKNVPKTFDTLLSPANEDGVRIRNADNIHLAPIDFQKEEDFFIQMAVSERLEDLCQDGAKLKCVERKGDGLLHMIEYTRVHHFDGKKTKLKFIAKDLGELSSLEKPGSKEFVTILTRGKKGKVEERTHTSRGSHPILASITSGFFNALTKEEGLIQANQKEIEDNPFLGIIAAGTMTIQEKTIESKNLKRTSQDSLHILFAGSSGRYGAILASQIPPHLNLDLIQRRNWWEDYEHLSEKV